MRSSKPHCGHHSVFFLFYFFLKSDIRTVRVVDITFEMSRGCGKSRYRIFRYINIDDLDALSGVANLQQGQARSRCFCYKHLFVYLRTNFRFTLSILVPTTIALGILTDLRNYDSNFSTTIFGIVFWSIILGAFIPAWLVLHMLKCIARYAF